MRVFVVHVLVGLLVGFVARAAEVGDVLEEASDPAEVQRVLQEWRDQPLDLNAITSDELALLPDMGRAAAAAFIEWRRTFGPIRTIAQLQECNALTSVQRETLGAYTRIRSGESVRKTVLRASSRFIDSDESSIQSDTRLYATVENGRQLRGFLRADRYQPAGDYLDRLSGGIRYDLEAAGLRFYGGDYELDFGTGLQRSSGWGAASWLGNREQLAAELGRGLVSRAGSNRLQGFRGGAVEWSKGDWRVAALSSNQLLDAALAADGARITEGSSSTAELSQARADQLTLTSHGFSGGFRKQTWRVECLGLRHDFSSAVKNEFLDGSLQRVDVYGLAASLDWQTIRAVGEGAISGGDGRAWNAVLSSGNARLGASSYVSYANASYYSPGGSAWGAFGGTAGNQERVGMRGMLGSAVGHFYVHGYEERRVAASADLELSNPRETIEFSHRAELGKQLTSEILAARTWRGDVIEGRAEDVQLDRLRCTLRSQGELQLKVRGEWRAALRSGGRDHAQGSYLLVEVAPHLHAWQFGTQVVGFSFENDDVATAIYERTLGDEFPLAALSGTGARSMALIARDFGFVRAGIKGAYFHRDLHGGVRRSAELAIALVYRDNAH